jgi:hypothetical protein
VHVGIVQDIDNIEDKIHGHRQMALFQAFCNEYCYLPMHNYRGESGKPVLFIIGLSFRSDL